MRPKIQKILREEIAVKRKLLKTQAGNIEKAAKIVIECLKKGGKILICGNGGSAADAQHIAAEFVGRFKLERIALPAIALTVNTSILTAIANDYGYEEIFKRQLEALAKKNDILLGISTSGNSPNVIKAIKTAKKLGLATIALSGSGGGQLSKSAAFCITVPSKNTARIQESHIAIAHIICELAENMLQKNS